MMGLRIFWIAHRLCMHDRCLNQMIPFPIIETEDWYPTDYYYGNTEDISLPDYSEKFAALFYQQGYRPTRYKKEILVRPCLIEYIRK